MVDGNDFKKLAEQKQQGQISQEQFDYKFWQLKKQQAQENKRQWYKKMSIERAIQEHTNPQKKLTYKGIKI